MMTTLRLLCTDPKSESIKRLADKLSAELGYKVFRSDQVQPNRKHIRYGDQRDKLAQYKYFFKYELNFPPFTESKALAKDWVKKGNSVLCRVLLQGQEGHGIIIADKVNDVVDAPVYVLYKEKTIEFRVNLYKRKYVNHREKRRKIGFEEVEGGDDRIRNIANGYVYCLPRMKIGQEIINTAIMASYVTDSDIVGVDIGYDKNTGEHFIIEVNSAPALEGVTVDDYVKHILGENE